MPNPFVQKLVGLVALGERDRRAVEAVSASPVRMRAGQDLIRQGETPENTFVLLGGWACRYVVLPDGRRQIIAFLLPGDSCDPHASALGRMDHSIGLLSDAQVAVIPKQVLTSVGVAHPAVERALRCSASVDQAILRQWLISLGRRNARARLAHLICELWERLHQVDLTNGGQFHLPLTQDQLADAVSLTSVHVNRVFRLMRLEKLISFREKRLDIIDGERLRSIAGFDPSYLRPAR